mgnify:CR=1 FL=1|jgi:hypothetical protein
MRHKSQEEKTAEQLAKLVCDLRLDIEQVGVYVGRMLPATTFRRLQVIAESAEHENQKTKFRIQNYPILD